MPTDPPRLFLGLWPDEASLRDLQTWADGLAWPAGAKRTPSQHLHLTVHFLGDTEASRVPAQPLHGYHPLWQAETA